MQSRQEVDKIVLLQLKQLQWKIQELSEKQPDDFPAEFPQEMSQRFRICTDLATIIRDFGYKNDDLSFDTFLYPNEISTRVLVSFLVEQLQSKSGEEGEQASVQKSIDTAVSLTDRIQQSLVQLSKQTWTVPVKEVKKKKTQRIQFRTIPLHPIFEPSSEFEEKYGKKYCPSIASRIREKEWVPPSVFEDNLATITKKQIEDEEWETRGIESGMQRDSFNKKRKNETLRLVADVLRISRKSTPDGHYGDTLFKKKRGKSVKSSFAHRIEFETEAGDEDVSKQVGNIQKTENPEEEEKRRAEEMEKLQSMLEKISIGMDKLRKNIDTMNNSLLQSEEDIHTEKSRKKQLEEKFKVAKSTANLMKDKDKNMKELEQISSAAATHLINLATEWESHRKPLIEKYRGLKKSMLESKTQYRKYLEQVKTQKDVMKKTIQDIRSKEQALAAMKKEYEELPKDVERSTYVVRIMHIVRNVEKQKKEIQKVLEENRELQNEVANLSEKLSRAFTETEELIFKDAQKDENSKKLYRILVDIRKNFDFMIEYINETGNAINQTRSLEHQIQQLNQRNDFDNMERIAKDLEDMKKVNMQLFQQLKQK